MNGAVVQTYLAMTERHIHAGERRLSRQREIVAGLERLGESGKGYFAIFGNDAKV
jgi:hypothetical protein